MTFDKALEELSTLKILNPEMRDILEKLRKTYAPEIEMTQDQKDVFEMAMKMLDTSDLAGVVESQGPAYSMLDELSGRLWGHKQGEANDEQIKKTIRAWLNPELIVVI